MYSAYGSSIRSVRSGDMKLSAYLGEHGGQSLVMYNLRTDPMELVDIHDPADPVSRVMHDRLLAMRDAHGDTDRPESIAFWSRMDLEKMEGS